MTGLAVVLPGRLNMMFNVSVVTVRGFAVVVREKARPRGEKHRSYVVTVAPVRRWRRFRQTKRRSGTVSEALVRAAPRRNPRGRPAGSLVLSVSASLRPGLSSLA